MLIFKLNLCFVKTNRGTYIIGDVSISYDRKKLPVPTKRAIIGLFKTKSCIALVHMLMVCIRNCLNSFLTYKFLIFDTYHLDTPYLHEQGCEDPWLFFEARRGPRGKMFGELCSRF